MSRLTASLNAIYRPLTADSRAANIVGTLVVLGLVLIVNAEVIARGVFSQPFNGTYELVQYSIVLIVFLQLPDVVRTDTLTRSDGLLLVMGNTRPRFSRALRRIIDFFSAVLMVLIVITIWPEFIDAWTSNDFFGTPGIFTAPWWPVRLIMVFSAALCALIWFCKAFGVTGDTADPVTQHESASG